MNAHQHLSTRKHAIRDGIFRMQLTSVHLPFVKPAPLLIDM